MLSGPLYSNGFEIVRNVKPVTNQMVADRLDDIRERYARWDPIEGPAIKGDRVAINYATAPEGQQVGPLIAEYFTIGGGRTVQVFEDLLATMKVGDRIETTIALGDDFPDPASRGTVRACTVEIEKVERKTPAALEEAAKIMGLEDVPALLARVKQELARAAELEADREARWALLSAFAEANLHIGEVTPEAIAKVLDDARAHGFPLDTEEAVAKATRNAAIQIRLPALLDLIVQQDGLQTTQGDLRYAAHLAARDVTPRLQASKLLADWKKHGVIDQISRNIAHNKAIKRLERDNPYVSAK